MIEHPSLETATSGSIRFNTDSSKLEIYNGEQWFEIDSTSPEEQTGGTRGLLGGGYSPTPNNANRDYIDQVNVETTGNAIDFGNLTQGRRPGQNAAGSRTRAIWMGGRASPLNYNIIDFVTIASAGNASDFGDLLTGRGSAGVVSSATRGICAEGTKTESPSDAVKTNVIEYVTIAQTGNAVDFGDSSLARSKPSGAQSQTRGLFMGGYNPTELTTMNFITMSTLGNTADFGDLTSTRRAGAGGGNSVRAIYAGGERYPSSLAVQTIDFITIATLGNSQDFGDSITGVGRGGSANSPTRMVYNVGNYNSSPSGLEYIQIMTTGNSIDYGDLANGRWGPAGTSNGHRGLG